MVAGGWKSESGPPWRMGVSQIGAAEASGVDEDVSWIGCWKEKIDGGTLESPYSE